MVDGTPPEKVSVIRASEHFEAYGISRQKYIKDHIGLPGLYCNCSDVPTT